MKNKKIELYSVIFLGDSEITSDLGGCLTISCTNMRSLSLVTGLPYDRLVYMFTRKSRNVLVEGGNVIIKTNQLYKGSQKGQSDLIKFTGFNR